MMEALGRQLNGQVHLAYEPGGFVYTLDAPLKSLTMKSEQSPLSRYGARNEPFVGWLSHGHHGAFCGSVTSAHGPLGQSSLQSGSHF